MVNEPGHSGQQVYDRWFLLGEKRNEPLALREVQQYGRDSFGDPDYVSVYGLKPHQWYARGVRILGRTAVECTSDPLAALIGRDIAAAARAAPAASPLVIDLFAGSGNTLYWIKRHTGARRAIGFELDDAVFELARTNLHLLGLGIGDATKVGELVAAHGRHPIWEIEHRNQRLGVVHPGVGAPLAAAFVEEAIALGAAAQHQSRRHQPERCGARCARRSSARAQREEPRHTLEGLS